jgi:2-amino-4-hydroxy-6-hydroxymethyldihydropteridine diphosphokinase
MKPVWQMADGRWQMADGRWQMADDTWQMADDTWQMADGRWQMADGRWQVTHDHDREAENTGASVISQLSYVTQSVESKPGRSRPGNVRIMLGYFRSDRGF